MEKLKGDNHEEIVLDLGEQKNATTKMNPFKKGMSKQDRQLKEEDKEAFNKEYMKMGGIQHIICSATMTIDNQGRITPRQLKKKKKQNFANKEGTSTLDNLCKTIRFKSKNPKIIDLTENEESKSHKLPDTLEEIALRCKVEEKDLYLHYYL